jgi:hypothetical protein
MSTKKQADSEKAAAPVTIDDPNEQKCTLRVVGGSKSDHWNSILANQAMQTLWTEHSDEETRHRQRQATVMATIGIGPKD